MSKHDDAGLHCWSTLVKHLEEEEMEGLVDDEAVLAEVIAVLAGRQVDCGLRAVLQHVVFELDGVVIDDLQAARLVELYPIDDLASRGQATGLDLGL